MGANERFDVLKVQSDGNVGLVEGSDAQDGNAFAFRGTCFSRVEKGELAEFMRLS